MDTNNIFIAAVRQEFPDDRLTYQNRIATFHPDNADEAAELMKLANKIGQKLFITGFGNNISVSGDMFDNIVVVKTDRLNNLIEISSKDLYVTVGAGYPLNEINQQLKANNLFLPHSSLPYPGSVGGAVATGLRAEHNSHDLPLKRYFLQASIVTPEGAITKPGSICFKSVSGYDVVKIFAGSWGLLGLIISATFRVIPDTAAEEFAGMRMKEIDRDNFIAGLDPTSDDVDIVYSRKIKQKYDPGNILPIV